MVVSLVYFAWSLMLAEIQADSQGLDTDSQPSPANHFPFPTHNYLTMGATSHVNKLHILQVSNKNDPGWPSSKFGKKKQPPDTSFQATPICSKSSSMRWSPRITSLPAPLATSCVQMGWVEDMMLGLLDNNCLANKRNYAREHRKNLAVLTSLN